MTETRTTPGRWLPATVWASTYSRTDLAADARAGATVAVLVVPQAMAYADLAGVPPIAGLYAALVSLVVYALLGTSRWISVGPVAIDSLLTAAAIAPLAHGSTPRYVALASACALIVGGLQVAAGLLRLGAVVNLLSVPVISGFTSAAALTIAATQLTGLLGLDVEGQSPTFLGMMELVAPRLDTYDVVTALIGVVGIAALLGVKHVAPRVPGPLLLVTVTTVLVAVAGWDDRVALIGAVPTGLPAPGLPPVGWDDVVQLLPSAAAIALISYMESISTGSAFARRTRTRVDPDAELIALGTANAGAGLAHGFPVAGGFSRGAVNFQAGARTPMSGVISAALIGVALFTITDLLAQMPKVALAAIIMVAVTGLIDARGALGIGRVRRSDLVALLLTAAATLLLGPALGLGAGVLVSVVLFLRHMVSPHMPVLGRMPDADVYRAVRRHRVLVDPRCLIVRVDAPLTFASARAVADTLAAQLQAAPDAAHLVLDCTAITTVDYTGAEMLGHLCDDLEAAGVELRLAAVRGPVHEVLLRTPYYRALIESGHVHVNVPAAVHALPLDLAAEGTLTAGADADDGQAH